jgi:hypothetical protein
MTVRSVILANAGIHDFASRHPRERGDPSSPPPYPQQFQVAGPARVRRLCSRAMFCSPVTVLA